MADLLLQAGEFFRWFDMRRTALMIFLLLTSIGFISQRFRKPEREVQEDLSQFEVDEEGLYPWEVDQDDSPERIGKETKRYINQHGPKRGRW